METIQHLVCVVNEYITTKQNKAQLIRDLQGHKQVTFYQWTAFLQNFFKPIANKLTYRRLFVDAKHSLAR